MTLCVQTAPSMRRGQSGVGLIEVLIAVLVLSIGFLGIAALQARSLSMNNSAMARSMATMASYSILDAMRADINNAQAGAYNTNATPLVADACPNIALATTLADYQMAQWCNQLGQNLGVSASTTGTIKCTSVPNVCVIVVTYDDSKSRSAAADTSTMQNVTTQAML